MPTYARDDYLRQIDPLSRESMGPMPQYRPAAFLDHVPQSTRGYLPRREPSFSFEEREANPAFHYVIRPALEGKEPEDSLYFRRLSQASNSSSYDNTSAFSSAAPSRSRFTSVSSLASDCSFYQKGNLHPVDLRGSSPIQEEEAEEQEDEEEDEEESEGEEVEEVVTGTNRYQTPPPSNIRSDIPVPAPAPLQPRMPTRNLRPRAAQAAPTTPQWVCKACNVVYVHRGRAETHMRKFKGHYF